MKEVSMTVVADFLDEHLHEFIQDTLHQALYLADDQVEDPTIDMVHRLRQAIIINKEMGRIRYTLEKSDKPNPTNAEFVHVLTGYNPRYLFADQTAAWATWVFKDEDAMFAFINNHRKQAGLAPLINDDSFEWQDQRLGLNGYTLCGTVQRVKG